MSDLPLSTEAQQIVIENIVGMLREAIVALYEKKQELESLEKNEELKLDLVAINFRMDTLIKVECKLLDPFNKFYTDIEEFSKKLKSGVSVERLKPIEVHNAIRTEFITSIMQGL